jgi:hypothetical protein
MYKLIFTLKQHTPLIQFQHDQEGATLRASEVKPKLDKFIIKELGGIDNIRSEHPLWFTSTKHDSLNYKVCFKEFEKEEYYNLKITSKEKEKDEIKYIEYSTENYPLFIANMGGKSSKEELKNFSYSINLKLIITCYDLELQGQITSNICDFLFLTNFGNRQSKGFGCFYIDEIEHGNDNWFKPPQTNYYFDIFPNQNEELGPTSPFKEIDLFYRAIRGGLNQKKKLNNNNEVNNALDEGYYHKGADGNDYRDVFYFKSLMFLYAKKIYSANWEKRKIKEKFFPTNIVELKDGRELKFRYRLDEQMQNRPNSDQLTFTTNNFYLFRDILGLSTDESWKSYKSEIHKSQAQYNNILKKWEAVPEKKRDLDRFQSPILFKPFEMVDNEDNVYFRIFILLNQGAVDEALRTNKDYIISNERSNLHITFPKSFILDKYFQFFLDSTNFDITTHVEKKYHNTFDFKMLMNIFNQLRINNQNHE